MTTIASLDVQTRADPAGLSRDLNINAQNVQQFARRAVQALSSIKAPEITLPTPDTTDIVRHVQRFAQVVGEVAKGLPDLTVSSDTKQLDQMLVVLRRFQEQAAGLTQLPTLSTAAQVQQVTALRAAVQALEPVLGKVDASGLLRNEVGVIRGGINELLADLRQLEQTRPIVTADTAPLTAAMQGAVATVKGSTDQIRRLLSETLLDEETVRRALGTALPGPVGGADPSPEAARLTSALEAEALASARAQQAMDNLTAAEAQQAIAAIKSGAASAEAARQAELQGRASAIAAEQIAQAQRLTAATPPGGPSAPPSGPPSTVRTLASREEVINAQSVTADAVALERMKRAESEAAEQAKELSAQVRGNILYSERQAAAAEQVARATGRGTGAFHEHAIGAYRATQAIAALAASSVGAEGPIARVAESALLFSGGELAVVAVASGVLALGAAYRFVTTAQREAQDQQDKYVRGLLQEADSAIPPAIRAQQALTAALQAQRKAREGTTPGDVGRAIIPAVQLLADPSGAFAAEFARRSAEQQENAIKAVTQAQLDQNKALQDNQAITVRDLSQGIQLRLATETEIKRAQDAVIALSAEEKDTNKTLAERIVIHQQLVTLQQALNSGVLQEIAARAFQLQQEETRISALAAAPGLGTDTPASIRERATEEARLNAIIHDSTRPLTERNDAQTKFNQLVAGAEVPLERQRQAALQVAAAEASAYHDVAQAFADAIGVVQSAITALPGPDEFGKLIARQKAEAVGQIGPKAAPELFPNVERDFNRATEGAKDLGDQLVRARHEADILDQLIADVGLNLKDIGNANVSASAARDLDVIFSGLQRIGGALENIGVLSQEGAQSLGDVLDLGRSIASGDLFGAIASGINVLNDVFGKSALEREHDAILEKNTQAIEHNSLIQDRNGQAITNEQAAAGIAAAAAVSPGASLEEGGASHAAFDARVQSALLPIGLDIQDLEEIAKRHGIELEDAAGHLIPEAVKEFNDAVKSGAISVKELTDAADAATHAMLGIPEGFKVAAAEFRAQDPLNRSSIVTTGSGNDALQSRTSVSTGNVVLQGDFHVHVDGTGSNPEQTADAIIASLRRRATASRGRTISWAEAN